MDVVADGVVSDRPSSESNAVGSEVIEKEMSEDVLPKDTVLDGDHGNDMDVVADGVVLIKDTNKVLNTINRDINTINQDSFSENDHARIYKIASNIQDKFIKTSADNCRFQASVLSLYVHALRVHFLSRKYFGTRKKYVELGMTETYQKHKENFYLLEDGNLNFDKFKTAHNIQVHPGLETLTTAISFMFPEETGFHPTLISNFPLPRKNVFHLSNEFTEVITNQQKQSATDTSIIFVDFSTTDFIRGASTAEDFPNRIYVKNVGVYQTVGALYCCIDPKCTQGTRYASRILNRGHLECEYSIYERFFQNGQYIESRTDARLNYIKDWDDSNPDKVHLLYNRKCYSMFPATITYEKTVKYQLVGVVMCLNDGQSEGTLGFTGVLSSYLPNTMSRLEPIGNYSRQFIYHRELYILMGQSNEWLSDEIVNSCCTKFQEFVVNNKGKCGEYIPPFVFQSLLQHLLPLPSKTRTSKSKKTVLDESKIEEGYLISKALWDYKNVFDYPDSWFFSVLNYPDQSHWIHIGILARENTFIVYDPLNNSNNTESVGSVVKAYLTCEFVQHQDSRNSQLPSSNRLTIEIPGWIQLTVAGQVQHDGNNCGVLCLISFFRAIKMLNNQTSVPTAANLTKKWNCAITVEAFKVYRRNLFYLMMCEITDLSNFEYFYNILLGYISGGETLF